jgi:vacuolar protein sorting-associated protein 13A/C
MIELNISTDGEKFLIKISDYNYLSQKISRKKTEFELQAEIPRLGISLIGDNTYSTCHAKNFNAYNRTEICYVIFENIIFFYTTETREESCNKEIQIKIKYFEIDNQISPFTNFPIIVIPNNENSSNKEEELYFFNAVYGSEDNFKENIFKILRLSFLIQSFYLNLESNILSAILNFVKNITLYLKTYLTDIHPLYLPDEENFKNHIIIKSNYSFPPWFTSLKGIDSDENNIFLCHLETSPIDILFSFISENKDKLFSELLMNNPILRKFTTLVSNIEQTNLTLNKDIRYNIHGKKEIIMSSIIDTYKQYLILNLMKIGVNIEILGTPLNLVKSLGTGVKDFFQKPVQGMLKGPLDGAKGLFIGTKSLVKNTVGGTLNTVSKITSGFSKEILILAHDENYINQRERKNMMHKPKTFVEGIGYGISSMMSGIYYGVTDVVRKPLEGAKKENLKGFGKGMIQGLGGLISKPVSGVVDFFSKTATGIKNNMTFADEEIFQQRFPRPFYGKFKNIRTYNLNDARVIYYINTHIPGFNKRTFNEYVGSVNYTNEKKEQKLLVFGVNEFFLIEFSRFELVFKLGYKYIKDVTIGKKFVVIINFNTKINGKISANLKLEKETREQKSQKILKLFNEAMNVDN